MTAADFAAFGWVEVTHLDLVTLVQRAYDLSQPRGMGFLHFTPGAMSRPEAEGLLGLWREDPRTAVDLDYINGRAVKFTVLRASDDRTRLFCADEWFDHDADDFRALLAPTDGAA